MKNTEKTTVMSLHIWQQKNPLKAQINFDCINITGKFETKFLDIYTRVRTCVCVCVCIYIYINENIKWDVHIECLSSKCHKSYYVTLSLKDIVSTYITSVSVLYTAIPA